MQIIGFPTLLAPDCQGRATSLPDTQTNLNMYFDVYMDMFGHQPYMYTVGSIKTECLFSVVSQEYTFKHHLCC